MSKVSIAAINLKGGSCKTSTIINLGGVIHEDGHKPILIDLDPQKSATRWAAQGGDRFPYPVIPIKIGKNIKQFKDDLQLIIKKHKANVVLFDTPPQLADAALLAALLCDKVLIPITPSPLDIWAAEEALFTIRKVQQERKGLPEVIFVPSRLVPNTVLAKEINGTLGQFEEKISPAISMRVVVVEASISGLPINHYAPGSHSHQEFKNLMKFVFTNLRKS